jgi:N-acetyl-anhydromuramyl-L-alanine amidase AmpD
MKSSDSQSSQEKSHDWNISGMAELADFQFDLPSAGRPVPFQLFEQPYPGVRQYWEGSTSKRVLDPILGVAAIVVHASGGADSEGVMSAMKARKGSWHWIVPDEDEAQHGHFVWAGAPEARAARHVRNSCSHPDVADGRLRVNHFSLGIQIVSRRKQEDPLPFSDWQVFAAGEIIRYCWAKYPNLKHVVAHARLDPTRHGGPGAIFPWDRLRGTVVNRPPGDVAPMAALATPMTLLRKLKPNSLDGGQM